MASILGYVMLLALIPHFASAIPAKGQRRKQLLYVLLDGLRHDYVDRQAPENLPGFTKFLQEGVRAKWMTSIFPSVSYPSLNTLMTGLYAESHGIVGNFFYDAAEKEEFSLYDRNSTLKSKWWTAEQIWTTSTRVGKRTGVIGFWYQCTVSFAAITPEYCVPYSYEHGVEIVRTYFDKAIEKLEDDFDFVVVYTEHIDRVGHSDGPESEAVDQAMREVDAVILHLLQQLEARNLADNVNIVIVSDHGMVDTAPGAVQTVEMDEYLPLDKIEKISEGGAFSNIKVLPGHVDEVYNMARKMPGVQVYRHDEIPDRLHYRDHKFIHDIVLKADIDTLIMASKSTDKMLPPRSDTVYYGYHGYDPAEEKMRATFFAKGPDFKSGQIIDPIQLVDVYPLLAHLLRMPSNPNNGTLAATSLALVMNDDSVASSQSSSLWGTLLAVLLAFWM